MLKYSLLFSRKNREHQHQKMSKTINKNQSDILLSRMEENPDIAKGFTKLSKGKVDKFWTDLTFQLNSAGPPVKSKVEWKKVWDDQKRYVRKKATSNKLYQRGTGGGPNKTKKFSPSEEKIYQLMGLKEAVDGVGTSSQSFGLACPQRNDIPTLKPSQPILEEEVIDTNGQSNETLMCSPPDSFSQMEASQENNSVIHQSTPLEFQATQKRKSSKMTTKEVVVEELETQKKLCEKVIEGISVMRDHNTEIQSGIKKLYLSIDRVGDKIKELLHEQKRHNTEMEQIRIDEVKSKIEKNRIKFELTELEVKIMKQKELNCSAH